MSAVALRRELVALHLEQSRITRRIAEIEDVLNPRRRAIALCGTDTGYYRHLRTLGEPACLACRNAHADTERARHHRRRTQETSTT